ncbi:MAG: hypothetical protein HQ509_04945 [Candidatus Marinimicrobia bacterium]|nr:hypothetical protein [Candidatus Neomarinimicrobiota bacterium]
MKKLIILSIFLSLGFATEYAGHTGSFLRIGTTARSIAMGSAFTAAIDDGFATYHNPAATAFMVSPRISVIHHTMPLDRRLSATGFAMKLPPTAGISLALIQAATTNIDGRTQAGQHTDMLTTSEMAAYIGFAQRIKPWLSFGINIKIMYHYLPLNEEKLRGNGSGFDVGVLIKLPKDRAVGFVVQDLNSGYHWDTSKILENGSADNVDRFPVIYRLGVSLPVKMLFMTGDIGIVADGIEYLSPTYRLGAEYQFMDYYFLRAGMGNNRIAFGTGMKYRFRNPDDASIDYSMAIDAGPGVNHIFTFAFKF